jgi:hypothetical protein
VGDLVNGELIVLALLLGFALALTVTSALRG